jgi:hypothetical protein
VVGRKIRSPKREIDAVIKGELYTVTKRGCWIWSPWIHKGGEYATFSIAGKTYLAHREVWRLKHGAIPAGMFICHHCDNPPCFNPEHLYLGTPATNSADCIARGRSSHLRFTRLSLDDIKSIRDRISSGVPAEVLTDEYKISLTRLMRIARGKEQPTRSRK